MHSARLKNSKIKIGRGFATDPTGRFYSTPDPLAGGQELPLCKNPTLPGLFRACTLANQASGLRPYSSISTNSDKDRCLCVIQNETGSPLQALRITTYEFALCLY